ncbi:protein kinase [Brevibacillus sp. WF146]|uniref:serine/threonine protein kinase n=1 Tax=Brevibacillus sp. WF146 TaxID=319501 RepID=UPI0007ED9656|nr:protein kinase [Brevibacillus sp. WF146]UYZ11492.1 protein kinase [Brevibacillus sp. WF146]
MWKQLCAWWNRAVRDRPYKPGALVGGYRIEEVLGMGSYGIAYRAVHIPSGRVVVLKQVKPSLRRSPKGEAMQHYEQRVLAALSHPQMPRWLESFRHRNDSFLVMTYIAGPTLEDLLFEEGAALGELEAARLIRQVEPASDLYALGHFFLFLLYSGYEADENQPERSWEEELLLSPEIRGMIRRLLQIDPAYGSVEEWLADLNAYLNAKKEQSNR